MNLQRAIISMSMVTVLGCTSSSLESPGADPTLSSQPPRNAITFWGHATSYIDIEGFGIVTDPVAGKSYDQTNVILISRAQPGQLDTSALKHFSRDVVVLCPEPLAGDIEKLGYGTRGMVPGDEYVFPGGDIAAVKAYPSGTRSLLEDDDSGEGSLGYVIHARGRSIYYTGDTEYFQGMYAIRREHAPDIVLFNLGDHLNSYDAMFAISALGNPTVIPVHRETHGNSQSDRLEELIEFKGDLIIPLEVGESFPVEEREAGVAPLTPVP